MAQTLRMPVLTPAPTPGPSQADIDPALYEALRKKLMPQTTQPGPVAMIEPTPFEKAVWGDTMEPTPPPSSEDLSPPAAVQRQQIINQQATALGGSPAAGSKAGPPPQKAPPIGGTPYDQLLTQINNADLNSLRSQGLTTEALRKQLSDLQGKDLPLNLQPIAALVDRETGSNFAPVAAPTETVRSRQDAIDKLRQEIIKSEQGLTDTEASMLKTRLANELGVEGLKYKREQDNIRNNLEWAKLGLEGKKIAAGGEKPSKGQDARDSAFGKAYAEFNDLGGRATAQKNLQLMKSAIAEIENIPNATGGYYGMAPDVVKDTFFQKQRALQQKVEAVTQESMKAILGSQFTEREGKNVLARSYNPRLSPEQNKRNMLATFNQLTEALAAKEKAGEHWDKYGTLKGFTYKGSGNSIVDNTENISDDEAVAEAQRIINDDTASAEEKGIAQEVLRINKR